MKTIVFLTTADVKTLKKYVFPALGRCPEVPHYKFKAPSDTPYIPSPDEVVLVMGNEAMQATLLPRGLVPKNRKVDGLRGTVYQASPEEGVYMVGYSPGIIALDPGKEQDVVWDVQLSARFAITGSLKAVLGDYCWVEHFEDMISDIELTYEETGKAVPVSFDTETKNLSPFSSGSFIVACGFTHIRGRAALVYIKDINTEEKARRFLASVRWLLTSPKVKLRLAHGKFDLSWVAEKWKIETSNFSMDTLLVGSMLNENRSNSLKAHIKHYEVLLGGYDDAMSDHDMSNMDTVDKDKLRDYLGGDVDGTLRISHHMLKDLEQEQGTQRLYLEVVHRAAKVYGKVERNGLHVDVEQYRALDTELTTFIEQQNKTALDLLPQRLKIKFADNLSLSRAAVLRDYFFSPAGLNLKPKLFTGKSGEPSTAKSHLEMFHTVPEAKAMCSVLTELNQAKKAQSTYVRGFLACLKADGKFHPSYFMHQGDNEWGDSEGGTVTGRLSAKDPAIQTLPKRGKWAKKLRKCFIAPDGQMFLECDFAQGELKLTACVAEEQTMLDLYLNGGDLHVKTGASMAYMSVDDLHALHIADPEAFKLIRSKAKAANFGLIYGMSAEGFQTYAWAAYGLALTLEEAQAIREAFFNTYQGLPAWHKKYKAMAQQHKQVVSPLGRIRHLPHIDSPDRFTRSKAERQAVNSPIQSCLSDMLSWVVAEVDAAYGDIVKPVATIHDAGYWLVPEDKHLDYAKRVTGIMQSLPFEKLGWCPQLPFTADATAGYNLGQMEELNLAA